MKQNSLLDKIRRVLSILLNLAVVRMEPIAIRMSWEAVGEQSLTFYTENSNLFSAAVCHSSDLPFLLSLAGILCHFREIGRAHV